MCGKMSLSTRSQRGQVRSCFCSEECQMREWGLLGLSPVLSHSLRCWWGGSPSSGLAPLGQTSVPPGQPTEMRSLPEPKWQFWPHLASYCWSWTVEAKQGIMLAWGQPHIGQFCWLNSLFFKASPPPSLKQAGMREAALKTLMADGMGHLAGTGQGRWGDREEPSPICYPHPTFQ